MSALDSLRHPELEQLCSNGEFTRVLERTATLLGIDAHDRVAELYQLLINIILHGPADYEKAIDEVRWHTDLSAQERNLLRKIFRICYDVARSEQDDARASSYQRFLRRLLLKQPLDVVHLGENEEQLPTSVEPVSFDFSAESFSPLASTPVQASRFLTKANLFVKLAVGKVIALVKRPKIASSNSIENLSHPTRPAAASEAGEGFGAENSVSRR